jgi:ankyrin repeat protein
MKNHLIHTVALLLLPIWVTGCVVTGGRKTSTKTPIYNAIRDGNTAAVLQELQTNPAVVNLTDSQQATPLHAAARYGRVDIARDLLARGASVNATDPVGGTPLHYAVESGRSEMTELLIAHGASVDAKARIPAPGFGPAGVTPFMASVVFGRWEGVPTLIKHGADCNWSYAGKDAMGSQATLPAIHWAVLAGRRDVVDLMLARGSRFAGTGVLISAVNSGNIEMMKLFLSKGAGVNEHAATGWTPLHAAAFKGRADMVQLLISRGAKTSAVSMDGSTPLTVAMRTGHASLASLLKN